MREAFFAEPYYRLVHAEGDRLPGVVIDRFGDTVVVQITTAGMERLTDALLAALDDVDRARLRDPAERHAGARARGARVLCARRQRAMRLAPLIVQENGVRYLADPQAGQKSGWYYDQRDNRRFMAAARARQARARRLLLQRRISPCSLPSQGAPTVTGLDSSAPALDLAARRAQANGVDALCSFRKAECSRSWNGSHDTSERFDIVDRRSAALRAVAQGRRDRCARLSQARAARRGTRGAGRLSDAGVVLAQHARPNASLECAAGSSRRTLGALSVRRARARSPGHPMLPETAYLKPRLRVD